MLLRKRINLREIYNDAIDIEYIDKNNNLSGHVIRFDYNEETREITDIIWKYYELSGLRHGKFSHWYAEYQNYYFKNIEYSFWY